MSEEVTPRSATPSIPKSIVITSNEDSGKTANLVGGLISIAYFESLLSDTLRATITFVDSGVNNSDKIKESILEGLPIVGQEKVVLKFEDNNKVTIGEKPELVMYVNKVTPISDDTRKTQIKLDLVSAEFIRNEKTRITKRYDGKISDHVKQLLTEGNSIGLKTKKDIGDIDETLNNYNYIGNNKKPFYIINWLSRKAISAQNQKKGKSAGYFFYETSKGYHFKSIDSLFAQEQKKSIIFNETTEIPKGYDLKALQYSKDNNVNVQNKLKMGAYSTRTILFDPFTTYYEVITPNAKTEEDSLKLGGKKLPKLNDEFNNEGTNKEFTRTTYYLLDKGTLPTGDSKQQIEKSGEENFEYKDILNQSIMRYNQFFASMASVTIPGDFSLNAGNMVYLDVPQLQEEQAQEVSKQNSGLYIIAELTHYIHVSEGTFTKLSLARDSFGKTGRASKSSIAN
tara:strand:- start:10460 stop:11821 length:1362 start_codon:yes stop_codon:yes gene_type:complete